MSEIKGWHVLACFVGAFSIIIGVNLTLAVNAVRSFPGLEVKNSYIASQKFDAARRAQEALGWQVSARQDGATLRLEITADGQPVAAAIKQAVLGRATSRAFDQPLEFDFDGTAYHAAVTVPEGNWQLRLEAVSADGTRFQKRLRIGAGQ